MCDKDCPAGHKDEVSQSDAPVSCNGAYDMMEDSGTCSTDVPKMEQGVIEGMAFTTTIGRVSQWRPTDVLCIKDGIILQLWVDSYGFREDREWRKLPSFEEASKTYSCTTIQ